MIQSKDPRAQLREARAWKIVGLVLTAAAIGGAVVLWRSHWALRWGSIVLAAIFALWLLLTFNETLGVLFGSARLLRRNVAEAHSQTDIEKSCTLLDAVSPGWEAESDAERAKQRMARRDLVGLGEMGAAAVPCVGTAYAMAVGCDDALMVAYSGILADAGTPEAIERLNVAGAEALVSAVNPLEHDPDSSVPGKFWYDHARAEAGRKASGWAALRTRGLPEDTFWAKVGQIKPARLLDAAVPRLFFRGSEQTAFDSGAHSFTMEPEELECHLGNGLAELRSYPPDLRRRLIYEMRVSFHRDVFAYISTRYSRSGSSTVTRSVNAPLREHWRHQLVMLERSVAARLPSELSREAEEPFAPTIESLPGDELLRRALREPLLRAWPELSASLANNATLERILSGQDFDARFSVCHPFPASLVSLAAEIDALVDGRAKVPKALAALTDILPAVRRIRALAWLPMEAFHGGSDKPTDFGEGAVLMSMGSATASLLLPFRRDGGILGAGRIRTAELVTVEDMLELEAMLREAGYSGEVELRAAEVAVQLLQAYS